MRTSCNAVSCCLVCGRDFAPSIAVAAATHRRTHAYASTNEPTLNGTDASTSNWASDRPRLWPQRSMSNTTYGNTSQCVYTAPHSTHRLYLSAKQQYAVARTLQHIPACSCSTLAHIRQHAVGRTLQQHGVAMHQHGVAMHQQHAVARTPKQLQLPCTSSTCPHAPAACSCPHTSMHFPAHPSMHLPAHTTNNSIQTLQNEGVT